MKRTSQITIWGLTILSSLALTASAQAQFSFKGGSVQFGGSGRNTPSFNIGRHAQAAMNKNWPQTGRSGSDITDMRYRGPHDDIQPKRGRIVVGSGPIGISLDGDGIRWNPVRQPGRQPIIIDDPGYGTPHPGPHPQPICLPNPGHVTPRPCPEPEVIPLPEPIVEEPQPVDDAARALELTFEARHAFKNREYAQSTEIMNQVLELSPASAAAYQFRALTHFAQANYDEAAADIYETLLRGPIWNWSTLRPLYAERDEYTSQYHALSREAKSDSESMSKHFLLAYHHLVLGHLEHGERELQKVLEIQPEEPVTTQLLEVVQGLRSQDTVAAR